MAFGYVFLFAAVFLRASCLLICPDATEPGSNAQMTCSYPGQNTVVYLSPEGRRVAACDPDKGCNNEDDQRYVASSINTTYSSLAIRKIQLADVGDWVCEDTFSGDRTNCSLVITDPPACNISINTDADELDVNEEIILTVEVGAFSCSHNHQFLLLCGNITEGLEQHNESQSYTSVLNISAIHFGLVQLLFNCNDVIRNLSCQGIRSLIKKSTSTTIANYDTSTAFPETSIHLYSFGVGVGIGVVIMMLIAGLCLLAVLPRRKTSCCPGKARQEKSFEINSASGTGSGGCDHAIAVANYDSLQSNQDGPTPYDNLTPYQTL